MAPVLSPPDYSCDFLIYVAASMEMVGMVLVQEDEELHEHVIYYLSPYRSENSLFPCGEDSLGYYSRGSAFETLHSPLPNLGHISYQSILVRPH